jgi:transcriptional regulator with XRE-family HTH domain
MATVKELRQRKGWSQYLLAVRAGLTPHTIWRIESGRAQKLMPLTRMALARALGVAPDEISLGSDG